ncbi:LysR family transcriptional regulator [Aeromicrobium sp.]
MTPAQLKAFASVVRHGSVKAAAAELQVTEAAVSMHVAQLRKDLGDQLFLRSGSGLAFTAGGLRLASRSAEILGLQDRTVYEVSQAAAGRRMLRIATSSLFAENAAPGLIEMFTSRAKDLDVELSVRSPKLFESLLASRSIDVAIGPEYPGISDTFVRKPFLGYTVIVVAGADHPMAGHPMSAAQLSAQTWFLGPSAISDAGAIARMIHRLAVPEDNQRIFQNDAAALEEAKRAHGLALAVSFSVSAEIASERLVKVVGQGCEMRGTWSAAALPQDGMPSSASEFLRFVTTPRATQAMLRGAGVKISHFRPSVHVTLWS